MLPLIAVTKLLSVCYPKKSDGNEKERERGEDREQ